MNPLLPLENEHTYLNYDPDMKDPRDFIYRQGDNTFTFSPEKMEFKEELNNDESFYGSIFLITQYIKHFDEKLFRLLEEHKSITKQCFSRYKSYNYRSVFRFFKEYISSRSLRVAYTDLLYWRVLKNDIDGALKENVLFTGIPIFSECLIKEDNTMVCKIPSHNNKFLGYLPIMLKSEKDDHYQAFFVSKCWSDSNQFKMCELLIPKYLLHKCDPIVWSINIQIEWFSDRNNKDLLDYILDDYDYQVNSFEHYMKVGTI